MEDRTPRYRITTRVLLFLVLSISAALPVAAFGMHQASRWAENQIQSTDRQLEATAHAAADELALSMTNSLHAAESFSDHVGARGSLSEEVLYAAIAAHTKHHPDLLGAYIADASGTSLLYRGLDGGIAPGGLNYADRDYFKEILRTGRAAISRAQVGRFTRVLSINVAAPIHDDAGKFIGITCSSLNLRGVAERARRAASGLPEGRLVMLDGEGRLLGDSTSREPSQTSELGKLPLFAGVPAGRAALRVGSDERGRRVRSVAVGLGAPITGFRVVAMSPESVIDGQVQRMRYQALFAAAALIALTLGVAAWLANRLSRPLRSIADTAAAVSGGEFRSVPAQGRSAPREMMQLARAINAMIARLKAYTHELESEVQARTAELLRANDGLTQALATIQRNEQLMRADIEQARLFQAILLPAYRPPAGVEIATKYAPLEIVSGDIFDICELGPEHFRIFLADATGHGVQAAMRTILLKSTYDRLKSAAQTPDELLTALNARLVAEFPEHDLFSTACCIDLRFSQDGAAVEYANAGNEPLYVFSPNALAREIFMAGPPLGGGAFTWPASERFQLERGELLLIATDGLIEQMNSGRRRFEEELPRIELAPTAESTLERIWDRFDAFRASTSVADDITAIAVRLPGG